MYLVYHDTLPQKHTRNKTTSFLLFCICRGSDREDGCSQATALQAERLKGSGFMERGDQIRERNINRNFYYSAPNNFL